MITVCSRVRDKRSTMVQKYSNEPFWKMPTRKLNPDTEKLSPLAKFLVEKLDGKYIGGFYNTIKVSVESKQGHQWEIEVAEKGLKIAEQEYKLYGIDKTKRAKCNWLFNVIEPEQTDEEYFNKTAEHMIRVAGINGRIVIKHEIFSI